MPLPPVVTAAWWRAHAGDVVTADVRWYLGQGPGAGRRAYDEGHLPGAVFVDLDTVLAAPADTATGRHPLPDPESFAAALGALGIGDDHPVVAYDDAGGATAARLVWMLRAVGHDAALLDGGLAAALAEPGAALETVTVPRPTAVTLPRPWPADRLAALDDVRAGVPLLLDARARERWAGEVEPVDPRAGHVPGAVNVPVADTLDPDGRLLPVPALRERFAAAGVTDGADVVASCGSGVTACHTLLALEHAGFDGARLWPGSFSQWSARPDLPADAG
ncbi:sulfurtransferase [Angustibacter aerolatus]|uniref:Sulfurtransferase n=1 Tax=Angustibacter aerolatus TaxID=1162965 RepID=A0ABQ6JJB0_9ACTN|nr:sulfurtransferase [Angustibacter aerolatus]